MNINIASRFVLCCGVLCCGLLMVSPAAHAQRKNTIGFNSQIRPILSEYCFSCHGPDAASRKADLRLDDRDGAIESGAIVPGKSRESELIARIFSDDPELVMPPPKSHKQPTAAQKQILAKWIDAGAGFEKHWAFIKPRRPALPQPKGIMEWGRNPIDNFALASMQDLQLTPNPPADRYRLARRVALDITGLPPSKAHLKKFIADSSDAAYTSYLETLLASSHAGEHRARYWLDAARYGDTHGMHVDNYREIWPYRDWVVQAFNKNMPFDRFVVEQLAGDLLPNPTIEQQIATGFNRCNITTSEGGAIPAELDVRYMVDRVETTATVFLGLTAGCAVCHDHKYDPLSQREFYQLGAFFNNTTQPAMDGNQKDTPPVVTLPADEYRQEWNALQSRRSRLRQAMKQRAAANTNSAEATGAFAIWWDTRDRMARHDHPVNTDQLLLSLPLVEEAGTGFTLPKTATWASHHPGGRRGIMFGEGSAFEAPLDKLRSDQPLTVSFWFRTPDRLMATSLFEQTELFGDKKKKSTGWKISSSTQGALTFEITDRSGNKIRGLLPGDEALRPRSWQHVCVRYSGGQSNSSITILVNGRLGRLRNATETLVDATELAQGPLKIAGNLPTAGLSDIRIFRRWITDQEVQLLAADYRIRKLLASKTAWSKLPSSDRELLTRYYDAAIDDAYVANLRVLAASELRRDYIYSRSTTTLVMQERQTPARAWILQRGEYDQRQAEVNPGVPEILLSRQERKSPRFKNRLDLARWLVHPDHPLTARVMVNRLWQSVFGTGLVKTSEDFGVMGDPPSHPELLDWLAVEFTESGWNVNHIVKLILDSATYRQSSRVTAEKLQKDPANRLLSRGPRVRLDAEVLRDQALAVSGLLQRKVGGPSVKPYQPNGLWNVVAITGSNTRVFKRDSGAALYRRSLYTFWKRTAPPPSMAAFNAPTREQCTVRRERTNTPLQALVLMNDPQFVEAARHLAQRTLSQHNNENAAARAKWMLEEVFRRPANEKTANEMAAAAGEFLIIFQQKPEVAKKLIQTGESKPSQLLDPAQLAAWTMVANTLMNRDDFVSR